MQQFTLKITLNFTNKMNPDFAIDTLFKELNRLKNHKQLSDYDVNGHLSQTNQISTHQGEGERRIL